MIREKLFKEKLKEWGLGKNLTKTQYKYMLKMANLRQVVESKKTVFLYRGARVSDAKLRRYAKGLTLSPNIPCKTMILPCSA